MDPNRTFWNRRQQELRQALSCSDHFKAVELFWGQHAMVHSAAMAQAGLWSFEDEAWDGVGEEILRRIPRGSEHSVAWLVWHLARIEDVTMNMLLAGTPQLLHREGWLERLQVTARDTGNAMDAQGVAKLSTTIDMEALRAYRVAVGRRTREIVRQLRPEEMKDRIVPARLQQVLSEGAVVK